MTRQLSHGSTHDTSDLSQLSVAELVARLHEAEETLTAIRNGDVDAVVVGGPNGQQVYTLENADRPYRVLIEEMQEGALTLTQDGTVLYCNQRFAHIVQTDRDVIIGLGIQKYLLPAEQSIFARLLRQRMRQGMSGEFTLQGRDGLQVPVNISLVDLAIEEGLPQLICAVVTDLTHSRQRSHELAAANTRLAKEIEERSRAEDSLKLALEAAGMGSWDLDLATDTSRRTLRHDQIFGYSELQPNWGVEVALRHFVPADRAIVSEAFARAGKLGSIEFEARFKRKNDGSVRWLHVKGQTYYEGANASRIAGVVADITDHRAVEEQLRQAQKMEAVGQLTGGIAHDFNNLLMVIGGSLEMISRRVTADEKVAPLFDAARQGIARGAKLNQQLLAFSRRQDLHAEVANVGDLIPTFEHLLDRAVGETVVMTIDRAGAGWLCKIDPHQLETALLNLAINARDAMPDGGELKLATNCHMVPSEMAAVWGATGGEYIVITVTDTGMGMTADTAARVFEPFFTTKEIGKGTGLGLSQVYGFAKQSHGFVTIESAPGHGTAVAIHLPRSREVLSDRREVGPAPEPETGERGTILVVEDDEAVRTTTVTMLHDLGFSTVEASSAKAAMAIVESGVTVDLVFSDIIMPGGMNGMELALNIRRRHDQMPILLTSGYTAQKIVPDELASQIHLLRKPYARAELSRAVSESLRRNPNQDLRHSVD